MSTIRTLIGSWVVGLVIWVWPMSNLIFMCIVSWDPRPLLQLHRRVLKKKNQQKQHHRTEFRILEEPQNIFTRKSSKSKWIQLLKWTELISSKWIHMKSQNIGASVFHIHLSLNCPSCNERIDTKLEKKGSIKKAILTGVALFVPG